MVGTYNSIEKDGITPTQGGYSKKIVVDQSFVLRIPDNLPLDAAAPLLCAGITTYSPLKRFNVGPGQKVGIVGLGGLGHMGVKIAVAMGAEVTIFSTSPKKEADAKALGAHHFVVTSDPTNLAPLAGTFNFILDTVSADHEVSTYLNLLGLRGVMVVVGVPASPSTGAMQFTGAAPLAVKTRAAVNRPVLKNEQFEASNSPGSRQFEK